MINRLIEPTGGTIFVGGARTATSMPVHELRRGIGYVIQQTGLFPHQTIADNIATVPRLLGWDKSRSRERVRELVDLVGLDPEMLSRYPAELSGGQQQRVGVARALAADPPVLLMDEPYSAVDPIVRARLQDELLALQQRLRKTIVLVTHDIDEAIKLADRIAILNVGGILEQFGPPAELLREPANEFVEQFLGDERALKRMALLTVGDVHLAPGPVLDVEATADEAREVMAKQGIDWVGVLDGDRLLGWVEGRGPRGGRASGGRSDRTVPDLGRRRHAAAPGARPDRRLADPRRRGARRRSLPRDADHRADRRGHGVMLPAVLAQADEPLIDWAWVFDHTDDIWEATIEHLRLTVIAVVVGFADLAAALDDRAPVPADLRADHLVHRHPLHDPEPRPVRVPHPDHRSEHDHGRDRAGELHAAHPACATSSPGSTASRRP